MTTDTIERAEEVARQLTQFKKYIRAGSELNGLSNGRASLTLQLLDIDPHAIARAKEVAEKETDSIYTSLTSLMNGE